MAMPLAGHGAARRSERPQAQQPNTYMHVHIPCSEPHTVPGRDASYTVVRWWRRPSVCGNEPMQACMCIPTHVHVSMSLSPSSIPPPSLAAAPLTAYRYCASSSGISTVQRRRLVPRSGPRHRSALARLETREQRIAPTPARVSLVLAAARWACLGHATAASAAPTTHRR